MYSLRSREEERVSKPGAVSTPVKHAEDHPPKTVEEVTVERSEKQAPTLPGEPRNPESRTGRLQSLAGLNRDLNCCYYCCT